MLRAKRGEESLHYNWQSPFPRAKRLSFTSSGENAVLCTCLMPLPWQSKFALRLGTARPRWHRRSTRSICWGQAQAFSSLLLCPKDGCLNFLNSSGISLDWVGEASLCRSCVDFFLWQPLWVCGLEELSLPWGPHKSGMLRCPMPLWGCKSLLSLRTGLRGWCYPVVDFLKHSPSS